jgi:hypothetical protein
MAGKRPKRPRDPIQPAMAAHVTSALWEMSDMVKVSEDRERDNG